jgi:hypothetical protein
MPTLLEVERAMSRAILGQDSADAAPHIAENGFTAAERLNVYRNTFLMTLTNALRLSYPAVHRLVGAEFFDGAAHCFIEATPPQSAYLNIYGADFADFLAAFPPAATLSYLADVARLEWAVNCALHAPDAAPTGVEDFASLADIAPEQLVFLCHPSIHLLSLPHPADAIWRAVLNDDDAALSGIDVAAGPVWLMVERRDSGVDVSRLDEATWRFTAALCTGRTFAEAIESAPTVDVAYLFGMHIAAGRFIGFRDAANSQAPMLER